MAAIQGTARILYPCLRSLFGCVSVAELIACFREEHRIRRIIKPFCLLTLFLTAVLFFPNQPYLYVGLLCGRIGDVFRRFTKKNISVLFGRLFFFLNHLFNILEFYRTILVLDLAVRCLGLYLGYKEFIFGVVGGSLFLFSDLFLTYSRYRKEIKRDHFYTRITYLCAERRIFLCYSSLLGAF